MEEDLTNFEKSQNLSEHIFIATLGLSWNLSSAEILASLCLQDRPRSGIIIRKIFFPPAPDPERKSTRLKYPFYESTSHLKSIWIFWEHNYILLDSIFWWKKTSKALKIHKTSLNIYLLPHSALSWMLSLAENPAILWLQDGATKWYYYQADFFSSCTRSRAKVN